MTTATGEVCCYRSQRLTLSSGERTWTVLGRDHRMVVTAQSDIRTVRMPPSSWSCPAADVGGVAGPVTCGDVLLLDGDLDVDVEDAGQDGGGEFGGELEQRGRASLAGVDPDEAESFAESVGADGATGLSTGEQPS